MVKAAGRSALDRGTSSAAAQSSMAAAASPTVTGRRREASVSMMNGKAASVERPAAFTIDYFRDDTTGAAKWTVASKQAPLPNDFPGKWKKAIPDYSTRTRWVADAPLIDTPRPDVRLVRSQPVGKGRRVLLALSPNGANAMSIRFAERTAVQRLGTPGETLAIPAQGQPDKALLRCSGRGMSISGAAATQRVRVL